MNANVTNNKFVNQWIAEMAAMVKPSEIILIDGTEAVRCGLIDECGSLCDALADLHRQINAFR